MPDLGLVGGGAPMGRVDIGSKPAKGVFSRRVHLNSGGYDRGGAYWGGNMNKPLFVEYSRDLGYVRFFRKVWRKDLNQWTEDLVELYH